MRDSASRRATPYGIVEMTPEREYLLVTEFFDGAKEIGDAEVDDDVIDEGLTLVRQLWDAGLAHRDIKPANLLVQDGQVLLIDVAFVQVRPSPWRQAVDLANMMLVLAVRTDAERVYTRALRYFTPDEIAEAFAAARGIASPTQLRAVMKQRRPGPAAAVPGAGAGATADLAPALERAARRATRSRLCSSALVGVQARVDAVDARPRPSRSPADADCGTERRDDPHGPVGPVGDLGAVRRLAPRRMGRSAASRSSADAARSGSTPTAAATAPSR